MPFIRKYPIPREVLERVAAKEIGCTEVARMYGCGPSTVRAQANDLGKTPAANRSSHIEPGFGGDREFARLIGNKVFGVPRAKAGEHFVPASRPHRQDLSLTGCAAALACV